MGGAAAAKRSGTTGETCRTSADDGSTMVIDFDIEQGERRFGPKRVVLAATSEARSPPDGLAEPCPAGGARWRRQPAHRVARGPGSCCRTLLDDLPGVA